MWERMDWPHLYRVRIADATGTLAETFTVLTWLGAPKAEWMGRDVHRSLRIPWALDSVEVTDLGPAPRTVGGFPDGPPGFLDDQVEY